MVAYSCNNYKDTGKSLQKRSQIHFEELQFLAMIKLLPQMEKMIPPPHSLASPKKKNMPKMAFSPLTFPILTCALHYKHCYTPRGDGYDPMMVKGSLQFAACFYHNG
jgi:hypothetical protein